MDEAKESPLAPGGFPMIGHTVRMIRNPLGLLEELSHHPSPILKLKLGGRTTFLIKRAELARQVLVGDYHSYDKGGPIIDAVRLFAGNGLASCSAADHPRKRLEMQPAFERSRLAVYAATMAECATTLADSWEPGSEISFHKEAFRMFATISTKTLIAAEDAEEAAEVLRVTLSDILRGAYRRVLIPVKVAHELPLPANLAYRRSQRRFNAAIHEVIKSYRSAGFQYNDVLSIIMASRNQATGEGLTDIEVFDEIRTILAGSVETEAAILSWAIWLLTQHPKTLEALRSEVDTVLQNRPAPDNEDLTKLPYTHQVIWETNRLYPPAWLISRLAVADTTLGGYRIPKGAGVVFSPYYIHRDSSIFPEPEKFLPERWGNHEISPVQRASFMGFGAGRRKCIGDVFGNNVLAVMLATIVHRWSFVPTEEGPVRPVAGVTLEPSNLTIRIEDRRFSGPRK
ncbi:MAG: cytochrome P450 [Actinophytocola sp.]|uniref:cytochrome P450 n=1 Tax=Actinophytocola sp. TaxID=1872138 RepID=UPI003C7929B7